MWLRIKHSFAKFSRRLLSVEKFPIFAQISDGTKSWSSLRSSRRHSPITKIHPPKEHPMIRTCLLSALSLLALVTGCDTPTKPIPMGRCAVEQECQPAEGPCLSPGAFAGCGICRRPLPSEICRSDADCSALGSPYICASSPTLCLCSSETVCMKGCAADSECSEGQRCGASHRCEPKACIAPSDCPTDFRCDGGQCLRKSCTTSRDCSGYCVGSACYSTPGTCTLPRP